MIDAMITILNGVRAWAAPKFKALWAAIGELQDVHQEPQLIRRLSEIAVPADMAPGGRVRYYDIDLAKIGILERFEAGDWTLAFKALVTDDIAEYHMLRFIYNGKQIVYNASISLAELDIRTSNYGEFEVSVTPTFHENAYIAIDSSGKEMRQVLRPAYTSNVLTKYNLTEYTPTKPYHPATKKYVDDSVAAIKPETLTLTGAVSATYDGSAPVAVEIPEGSNPLRLISHIALSQPASIIEITQDDAGDAFRLTEFCVQAYIPGNPELSPTRTVFPRVSIFLTMPDGSEQRVGGFALGRAHSNGFIFSRGRINLLTGECESSSAHIESGTAADPYSSDTAHYYGPVELDALKGIDAFAYSCIDSGGKISGILISAGLGNEFVAGTEFLIRGR